MLLDDQLRLKKYLLDAFDVANELQRLTDNRQEYEYAIADVKWLVERGIELIAEALKRASRIEADLGISGLNEIFATRNRIAHRYELVDVSLLYFIVKDDLPILIQELEAKLATL